MAKNNNPPQGGGRSKIRLFFVDADLAPGDMQELTNALTSAIRPTHIITKVPAVAHIGSGPAASAAGTEEVEDAEIVDDFPDDEDAESGAGEQGNAPKGASRVRSPRKVTVIDSLDPNAGGKPFKEFAVEKGNPADITSRFLIAAYWLDEYAKISEVSVDHIYTCHKFAAGWTFKAADPVATFRYFKREGLGTTKNGLFSINHIGRARVEEMKGSSSGS